MLLLPAAKVRSEPMLLTFFFAANVGFLGKVKEISAIYTSWASHQLIFRKASAQKTITRKDPVRARVALLAADPPDHF